MQNNQRALTAILKEIALERALQLETFSSDWIFLLRNGTTTRHVFGYDFELNPCTAQLIAKDKSATSDLLGLHRIPRVEHAIFHHPQMRQYVPHRGNWCCMLEYAQLNG